MNWINKDTEIYCSFAETAGNTGCQMMNTSFHYHGLNKIYKSFSVRDIESAVNAVLTLGIKGFAITMPYKVQVLKYVHGMEDSVKEIGAANTVINTNNRLRAYNTDEYATTKFLQQYDDGKKLYIIGNGGYSRAVQYSAKQCGFDIKVITRDDWGEIESIKNSIIYNCTPIEIEEKIHLSNHYINCSTKSTTGKRLANVQASRQFQLYTGLEFPL